METSVQFQLGEYSLVKDGARQEAEDVQLPVDVDSAELLPSLLLRDRHARQRQLESLLRGVSLKIEP